MAERSTCRSCGAEPLVPVLDLGMQPLPDAFVPASRLSEPERRFPLRVAFCPGCSLVQHTEDLTQETVFDVDYRYFSSFSDMLLLHSKEHADKLMAARGLDASSMVVELASNDGYLLKSFAAAGVGVLGIEPSRHPAQAARANGVPTLSEFFDLELARRLRRDGTVADVILANNVLAHVPDLNSFVAGIAHLLSDDGVVHIENPYVRDLVDHREFDTIYLEHFCYYSCTAIVRLARRHGLFLNDVSYFPYLHGGTLRWELAKHDRLSETARRYLADEAASGLTSPGYYADFAAAVADLRTSLRRALSGLRAEGARLAAYGAAAKGVTLLNYVGIGTDVVEFVVDRNPHKHGWFMPGTHQPIFPVEEMMRRRPDVVLLLAWNHAGEILTQQQEYLAAGGRFLVPVPEPRLVP